MDYGVVRYGRRASLSRRPENIVPQRRADSVSDVVVLVVMPKMILLQPEPYTAFHREMMRGVMQHIVTNITEDQPPKDARCEAPENQEENTVKQKGERNADARRHDKSPRVIRVIMMNAVNNIVQSLSQARLWFIMKEVPMDEIFDQRPQQDP